MSAKKMTSKEKRIDSDQRIIASAIRSFGELGYTYSSIRDIAKGAGITSGLITQRYGTKENLFVEAYKEVVPKIFTEMKADATPRECLLEIIQDIERLFEENINAFNFCYMLHNATDYPKACLVPFQKDLKATNSYYILQNAQERGMLPDGNLDELLAAFGAMVFHNTRLCKQYHLERTESEKMLQIIRFRDNKSEHEKNWFRVIEKAIENTFELLVYVNIPENKGEILRRSDNYYVSGDFIDARADIEKTIERIVDENEQQLLRDYLNLDTIGERMKGRKSISLKTRNNNGDLIVHSALPITWDDKGNLKEIFAGVYEVKEDEDKE